MVPEIYKYDVTLTNADGQIITPNEDLIIHLRLALLEPDDPIFAENSIVLNELETGLADIFDLT